VNALVGRLALIPSVHVYGLWREHHNVHHRYTNLRGRDFVWTPLSVAEYGALSRGSRALHRIYRNRSSLGLGLQYAIEIWAPRMLWPRRHHDLTGRGRLWADTVWLCASLIGVCVSAWAFVSLVEPDKTGDAGFWVTAVALLFLVPLMGTQWLIGFVIYLNHTHPDIRWYGDPTEWDQHRVQLEGSAGQRFPKRTHVVLPRRIMNHTAHHVDPGVPLRRLGEAQQQLLDTVGDRAVSYEWSPRVFRDVLSRCKLYDYDTQRWLTYPDPAEVTT
jgi:omega-6 fatty acid desaturase (delta-12 desaturase)